MARDPQVEQGERQRFDVVLHDAPVATDDLLTRLSRRTRGFSATTALQSLHRSARRATRRRRGRTGAPATDVTLGPPAPVTTKGRSEMSEHRDRAEQSLADAQRNPIQSAEELFTAAQVHALLAIEQTLGELLVLVRSDAQLRAAS